MPNARPIRAAALALAAAIGPGVAPAAAQAPNLPTAIAAFAGEQSAQCVAAGGTPRIGPAFATGVDLNGDGALDYIVDLAGIECANAWSAFCGSAGCPVSVWIAGPQGHAVQWRDHVQGWTLDPLGDEVAVVVERAAVACPEGTQAGDTCSERLTFAAAPGSPPPATPAAEAEDPAAAAPAPEAAPAPRPAAPAEALAATDAQGWTLRAVPDGSPVAVAGGPGAIETLAVFCLGGQPWLAATPRETPAPETARLEFGFTGRSVAAEARREEGAGGALIVALADSALPGLLSGRDTRAQVALDGVDQGVLSLRGSTRSIRAALSSCGG